MIVTEIPKFKQFSYTDEQSNITIEYNLYIPKNYDPNKKYPLVQFIPDASAFGKGTLFSLKQGYGGLVWTTEEAQAKNECFVYVPTFNYGLSQNYPNLNVRMESTVDDDHNVSEDVFVNLDVIKNICKNYSIDTDRIYTTGQSMGGILSFFYATYFNDVFAAYMPVGSQFNNNMVKRLNNRNIIYLVSEGDTKASEGMNELKKLLDENGTNYTYKYFSIKDTYENQNAIINEGVAEGNNFNLFMFKKGEVVPEGVKSNNEHMYKNGLGLNQNDVQANIYYHIGARRDDITSNYYLGLMYLEGKGVNKNVERAKYYFELAANSGNDEATGVKEAKEKLESIK